MGHKSAVLVLEGTVAHKEAIKMDIPLIVMPYDQKKTSQLPNIYRFIKNTFESLKPDIVNCHRGELFPLFVFLKKKYAYKLVRTRGDQRPARNSFLNRLFYNTFSDAVISTNSVTTKHLQEKLKVPEYKLYTILGGVDTKKFFPQPEVYSETRLSFGYTQSDFVVGLLGRLDTVKGQKESIIALAKALPYAEKLKLCLIGFNSVLTEEELYALAQEYCVRDKVQITGKVKEINKALNMCDIIILPSIASETIARAALEAIACNIPLLSSNVGVMPDLVEKNARFKTADIEDMSRILIQAHQAFDNKKSKEYSWLREVKKTQKLTLPELSLEAFGEKTLNIYNNIIYKD